MGALVGAGSQLASNAIEGKPLGDGVLLSAAIGGVSGGISGALVARQAARAAGGMARAASRDAGSAAKCLLSFSPDTPVATPDGSGERAIGSLQVGDQVTAYDPQTGQASAQTVEHVWINHDTDLIDLTLHIASDAGTHAAHDGASGKQREAELAAHGLRAPPADEQTARQAEAARQDEQTLVKGATPARNAATHSADETVHTTAKHPWLTADRGWVTAGQLRLGERVVRLDGTTAVVAAERSVSGAADYYNLTVSHLHTFAVGAGRYVVHNCGSIQQAADAHAKALGKLVSNPWWARAETTVGSVSCRMQTAESVALSA